MLLLEQGFKKEFLSYTNGFCLTKLPLRYAQYHAIIKATIVKNINILSIKATNKKREAVNLWLPFYTRINSLQSSHIYNKTVTYIAFYHAIVSSLYVFDVNHFYV